jgi:uncharacterized protein YndB with AHSA1/START domain
MHQNFSTRFTVDQSPAEVFAAINHVRAWWSEEVEGKTSGLGNVWYYHYQDVHRCTMLISEVIPNQKIVWRVLDNHFNFIEDQSEWVNTEISFEIAEKDGKTEVQFSHLGLVPDYECFEVCSNAWGIYINGSLRNLITKGKGQPNANGRATTADEVRLGS